jgi:MFS family permease
MARKFYGWWIIAATFITFGLSTGVPYYNMPLFYDYFMRDMNASRAEVTLGFPLAALLTLWVGPTVLHRFSPRKLILVGTALTCVALVGFGQMTGGLMIYYMFYVVYTVGYFISGPPPHQIIVSQWFRKKRGMAMGILYVGIGVLGSAGTFLLKYLIGKYDHHVALTVLGGMVLLAWPLVLFAIKDKPSDMGQNPDGDAEPPKETKVASRTYKELIGSYPFWLLLIGSLCSIGSIGAVNFHMKLVFRDQGFNDDKLVLEAASTATILILWSSIAGRLSIGYFADKFPKKWVMFASYFVTAATIPILLKVTPESNFYLYAFAILFGFGMGADYMMIPLMAADRFGVNSVARAMAVILPVNTIGQSWFPYLVSHMHRWFGGYTGAMTVVLIVSLLGAVAILMLPKRREIDAAA